MKYDAFKCDKCKTNELQEKQVASLRIPVGTVSTRYETVTDYRYIDLCTRCVQGILNRFFDRLPTHINKAFVKEAS